MKTRGQKNGSSTQHARGVGVILQSPEGDNLEYAVRLQFQMTNNKAKYEALIKGLDLSKSGSRINGRPRKFTIDHKPSEWNV